MKRQLNSLNLLLVAVLCLVHLTVYATDYWVKPTGVDDYASGRGTEQYPFKTIRFAISRVEADKGHTIRLTEGTFSESGQIVLRSGVGLVGAGSDKTFVKVNFFYNMLNFPQAPCATNEDTSYDSADEKFVIQINGSNQRLAGFTLDGQSKQCHGGIFMADGSNVVFDNLQIIGFRFSGIWLGKCTNTEVKYCTIRNNAFGNRKTSQGNVMFWEATNLLIHHNTIEELQATSYGSNVGSYGIKVWAPYFTTFCTGGGLNDRNIKTVANGVKIYDNTITVLEKGTWNGGQSPGITIEFHKFSYQNCEIYNNILNNHISLVGCERSSDGFQVTGKTMRVHHNTFNLGDKYAYGVENDVLKTEIDHNYFNGGFYPIAQFNDGKGSPDQIIHHNVFYNPQGNQGLLSYHRYGSGFKFVSNSLVASRSQKLLAIFRLCNGKDCSGTPTPPKGAEIKNNLFASTVNFGPYDVYDERVFDSPSISNNLFFNMDPFGTATTVADPKLVASGNKPRPFFELQTGSPAINKGVWVPNINLSNEVTGGSPDLGAYEYGSASSPLAAESEGEAAVRVKVFPNPNAGEAIFLEMTEVQKADISLVNSMGRRVPVTKKLLTDDQMMLTPQAKLVPGLYILNVLNQGQMTAHKIIFE